MDIVLVIVGFLIMILGLIGSFLPVLPGPLTGWVGLLVLHLTKTIPMNWTFLGITLAIAIIIWVLDYFIPAIGTKKFGGSRAGVIGTTLGLLIGLFFIPVPGGFIIGAFLGALIGEILHDANDQKRALKAAFGSFLGFLASATLKFLVSLVFLVLFVIEALNNWSNFLA